MSEKDPPDIIKCAFCSKVAEKASRFPCSNQVACFSCAIRTLAKNKLRCLFKECTKLHRLGDISAELALRKLVDQFKNDPASFNCSSSNSDSVTCDNSTNSNGSTNASDEVSHDHESPTKQADPAPPLSQNHDPAQSDLDASTSRESDIGLCLPEGNHSIPLVADQHANGDGSLAKNRIIQHISDELQGSDKSESGRTREDAASPSVPITSDTVRETDERLRFSNAISSLTGTTMRVETYLGEVYEGIFNSMVNDELVLSCIHKVDPENPDICNLNFVQESMVFPHSMFVRCYATDVDLAYGHESSTSSVKSSTFRTQPCIDLEKELPDFEKEWFKIGVEVEIKSTGQLGVIKEVYNAFGKCSIQLTYENRLKMVEMSDLDPVVRDAADNIIHNTQQMLSEPVDTKPMDDDNEREVIELDSSDSDIVEIHPDEVSAATTSPRLKQSRKSPRTSRPREIHPDAENKNTTKRSDDLAIEIVEVAEDTDEARENSSMRSDNNKQAINNMQKDSLSSGLQSYGSAGDDKSREEGELSDSDDETASMEHLEDISENDDSPFKQIESNPLQRSMSLEEISNDGFNNSNSKTPDFQKKSTLERLKKEFASLRTAAGNMQTSEKLPSKFTQKVPSQILGINMQIDQMMALRVDLMNWIHANYAKPPQSSSCADVDRGADEGDNNEKDIFFLEALDNFEIELNDRDIGEKVTIGVAVTGGAQPGTRLEVLGLHPLERVMDTSKTSHDIRQANSQSIYSLIQTRCERVSESGTTFATIACGPRNLDSKPRRITFAKGSVVGFAKKAGGPGLSQWRPRQKSTDSRVEYPIYLMESSVKDTSLAAGEIRDVIGFIDLPNKDDDYFPLVNIQLTPELKNGASLMPAVVTVQERGRIFCTITAKTEVGSTVDLRSAVIGTARILATPEEVAGHFAWSGSPLSDSRLFQTAVGGSSQLAGTIESNSSFPRLMTALANSFPVNANSLQPAAVNSSPTDTNSSHAADNSSSTANAPGLLEVLREHILNNKKILVKNDGMVYMGQHSWSRLLKMENLGYYTLQCLLFLLKNMNVDWKTYVKKANEAGIRHLESRYRELQTREFLDYLKVERSELNPACLIFEDNSIVCGNFTLEGNKDEAASSNGNKPDHLNKKRKLLPGVEDKDSGKKQKTDAESIPPDANQPFHMDLSNAMDRVDQNNDANQPVDMDISIEIEKVDQNDDSVIELSRHENCSEADKVNDIFTKNKDYLSLNASLPANIETTVGESLRPKQRKTGNPGLLFIECEILRDGNYVQFTQIGAMLELNKETTTFQAGVKVKHQALYDHYKQSQDLATVLNQEGMRVLPEQEAIDELYSTLESFLEGHYVIVVTNSPATMSLLKAKSSRQQFEVIEAIIYLREFLAVSGLLVNSDLDLTDEVDTEDVYKAVLKKGWKKAPVDRSQADRSPLCSQIAGFTRDILRHEKLIVSCKRPVSEIKPTHFMETKEGDQNLKELEIAYSYCPSAPVLVVFKYFIDFIDVENDDCDTGIDQVKPEKEPSKLKEDIKPLVPIYTSQSSASTAKTNSSSTISQPSSSIFTNSLFAPLRTNNSITTTSTTAWQPIPYPATAATNANNPFPVNRSAQKSKTATTTSVGSWKPVAYPATAATTANNLVSANRSAQKSKPATTNGSVSSEIATTTSVSSASIPLPKPTTTTTSLNISGHPIAHNLLGTDASNPFPANSSAASATSLQEQAGDGGNSASSVGVETPYPDPLEVLRQFTRGGKQIEVRSGRIQMGCHGWPVNFKTSWQPLNPRAEVYSLGTILHFLINVRENHHQYCEKAHMRTVAKHDRSKIETHFLDTKYDKVYVKADVKKFNSPAKSPHPVSEENPASNSKSDAQSFKNQQFKNAMKRALEQSVKAPRNDSKPGSTKTVTKSYNNDIASSSANPLGLGLEQLPPPPPALPSHPPPPPTLTTPVPTATPTTIPSLFSPGLMTGNLVSLPFLATQTTQSQNIFNRQQSTNPSTAAGSNPGQLPATTGPISSSGGDRVSGGAEVENECVPILSCQQIYVGREGFSTIIAEIQMGDVEIEELGNQAVFKPSLKFDGVQFNQPGLFSQKGGHYTVHNIVHGRFLIFIMKLKNRCSLSGLLTLPHGMQLGTVNIIRGLDTLQPDSEVPSGPEVLELGPGGLELGQPGLYDIHILAPTAEFGNPARFQLTLNNLCFEETGLPVMTGMVMTAKHVGFKLSCHLSAPLNLTVPFSLLHNITCKNKMICLPPKFPIGYFVQLSKKEYVKGQIEAGIAVPCFKDTGSRKSTYTGK